MATASVRKVRRQQSKDIWNDNLRKFFSCVRRGQVSDVDHYVTEVGIDVNVTDPWDNSALYLACLCGHLGMVRYLLKKGAKYDSNNIEGQRCFLSSLTIDIRNALRGYNVKPTHEVSERPVERPNLSDLTVFLQTMYERTPDYDVELLVGDQTFLGHKCILCVRCDYFYKRLSEPGALQLNTLELTDPVFTPGSLRAILQFLYTGGLDLPIEDAEDTQSLAAFLGFITLANSIEDELKQTISNTPNEDLPEQVINVSHHKQRQDLVSDLRKLVMSAVPQQLHHLVGDTQENIGEASKMNMPNAVTNAAIFPDICFCVGNHQFECHKIFFYGRSEYFRIMLIEKQDDQPPAMKGYRPVVKLDDVTAEDFVQVISYLYQDHCLATNQNSLLDVCDRWTLTQLKLQLTAEGDSVTVSNVMQTYLANTNNEQIRNKCYQCMSENFMTLASQYEFHQFLQGQLPVNSTIVLDLLHEIRTTAHTWQEKKFANKKIKKLNYIISNRLGYTSNFTLFDITPLPPKSVRSSEAHKQGDTSYPTLPERTPVPPESVRSSEAHKQGHTSYRTCTLPERTPVPPQSVRSSEAHKQGHTSYRTCTLPERTPIPPESVRSSEAHKQGHRSYPTLPDTTPVPPEGVRSTETSYDASSTTQSSSKKKSCVIS